MRSSNYYFHVVNVALKIIRQIIKSLLIGWHLLWHVSVRDNLTRMNGWFYFNLNCLFGFDCTPNHLQLNMSGSWKLYMNTYDRSPLLLELCFELLLKLLHGPPLHPISTALCGGGGGGAAAGVTFGLGLLLRHDLLENISQQRLKVQLLRCLHRRPGLELLPKPPLQL